MNEENTKLARIQKSTKIANVISRIFMIFAIVGCTICVITGVLFLTNPDKYDKMIEEQLATKDEYIYIDEDEDAADAVEHEIQLEDNQRFKLVDVDIDDIEKLKNTELESSVPAVQEYFDEHEGSISLALGLYILLAGAACGVLAASLGLISSVFAIILKEGNPFSDKVMKRVVISMIIISVVIALTSGFGFAILLGFITWVIYTILDYGRTLKTLSDETL